MIRTTPLLAGCLIAGAAFAATAQANVSMDCVDGAPVVRLTGWQPPANLADVTVIADGIVIRSGPLAFYGPDTALAFPGYRTALVSATAQRNPGAPVYASSIAVRCITPVPSPTPEGNPSPAPTTTTPAPTPTPTTKPRPRKPAPKPKPRPRPRVVTCGWILGHYSGPARARMTARYGFPNCGRPFNPPVAG